MARITVEAICDGIEATLGAATGIRRSQSYDELTEGIADLPLLQVYPEAWGPARTGSAHAITGRGGVRNWQGVFHADYYARTRSSIGEDMAVLVPGIDAIEAVLEAQQAKPLFGVAEIESFNWEASRVVFRYGTETYQQYIGARYVITVRVY
jgi:hypothetical protein